MANEEAACERSTVKIVFRFTDERHLKFVEAFSCEPCLWNRHPYLWGARVAACKRIQNVMNETLLRNETPISLQGIKMKIKNIRSVYHQELKKMRINPYYYPKSCWFEPLHKILAPFLDKNGDGNEELISPKSQKRLQVKVPRLKCIRVMPSEVEESTEIKIEHDAEADQLEPSTSTSPQLSVITSPPRSPSSNLPKIVNASSLQTALRNRDEDEFTFFGMSVAAQLRKMPLSSAMIMQSKIQHMISMERRKINGDTSEVNLFFQTELQGIF
ncbi:hypothetical protein KR215_006724 [Drosophila sulfurigaster]|nr:hypothetical protein KR215_006724 [Drosophila sulfurigaster]